MEEVINFFGLEQTGNERVNLFFHGIVGSFVIRKNVDDAIIVAVGVKKAKDTRQVWLDCIEEYRLDPWESYADKTDHEKTVYDYQVLLALVSYSDELAFGDAELDKVAASYLRASDGKLKEDKDDVIYRVAYTTSSEDATEVFAGIWRGENWTMAKPVCYQYYVDPEDFLVEAVDYAYRDELIQGALVWVIYKEVELGDIHFMYSDGAKRYLDAVGVDYEAAKEEYRKNHADENESLDEESVQEEIEETEEAEESTSKYSTGGTAAGGGSGTLYVPEDSEDDTSDNSSKESSSSSSSSSSKSKKSLNGWEAYDEGYDDVMYNDEYDEKRYKTDKDYAAGVDDARDEFEELYGDEFD